MSMKLRRYRFQFHSRQASLWELLRSFCSDWMVGMKPTRVERGFVAEGSIREASQVMLGGDELEIWSPSARISGRSRERSWSECQLAQGQTSFSACLSEQLLLFNADGGISRKSASYWAFAAAFHLLKQNEAMRVASFHWMT